MRIHADGFKNEGEFDILVSRSTFFIRANTTYGDHEVQDQIIALLTSGSGEIYRIEITRLPDEEN